jgi:predicted DNA-binding transcriptional regulator AlpA
MEEEKRPIYIRIGKVMKITTMSDSSIWRLVDDKKFPAPYKVASRATVWNEEEVYQHIYNGKLEPGNDTKH